MICEKGIYVFEAQSTLSIPQTTETRSVVMGNQIIAKPNLFCTNYHRTNHNMETCRGKKEEEPTITTIEAIIQVGKAPRPLNYPCHICGIVGHKLMNCLKFGEMQNMSRIKKVKPQNSNQKLKSK